MSLKDAMTFQTRTILLAILIITTFSLGILVFAQAPTGEIVNNSGNVQMSNNSVTSNPNLISNNSVTSNPTLISNNSVTSNPTLISNNSVTSNPNLMPNATGRISSAQNDGNNTWITWGNWNLVSNTSEILQNDSRPLSFKATISSVKSDNTERHKHQIHDFKLTDSYVTKNGKFTILTLYGTATMNVKDKQFAQVPVSIKIIGTGQVTTSNNTEGGNISWSPDTGTISIIIDDKKFHSHFGNTPIYGYLMKPKGP